MIRLQNLTNRAIRFQGALIDAYGVADFSVINDYVTLARLTNSGKARYFNIGNADNKPQPVKSETVEPVENEVPVTEKAETADEITEVEETSNDTNAQEVQEEVKPTEPTRTKRGKKRKNDSESN